MTPLGVFLAELSHARRAVVADGAWSTELYARGVDRSRPAEFANLERAGLVKAVAAEYLASGAKLLSTNTFCGNAIALAARGVDNVDVAALCDAGARLAREAVSGPAYVVGVVGPTGAIMSIGERPIDELRDAFRTSIQALIDAEVDGLCFETFSETTELLLAVEIARELCDLPIIASMSFDAGPQRTRSAGGEEAADVAKALDDAGVDVIGANCGAGFAHALPAVVALRANTKRPILARPSGGVPDLVDGVPAYDVDLDDFGAAMRDLIDAGANILGGCCGIGPGH
ncbi:MAG: homocysteine S-methyltransferase family protein, partial [Phycisphaerales bacterium]|nr:homocysteine S-methyltransferase family protein [Phycisphaerales bacterium]